MNLIARNTDYAIRSICCIAEQQDGIVSVEQLVRGLKMPRPFLRKILQKLSKKGILKSYKGIGGGFILAVGLKEISVASLIEIFQGPIKIQEHRFKKKICPIIKTCELKKRIDNIQQYVISELKNITLASLLEKGGKNG